VGDRGVGAGKTERVDGRVGVAHEVDGIVERCFAALVDGFAEQEDCAAIVRRLGAELIDGESNGVENGGAGVTFFEIRELARGLVGDCGEGLDDVRFAVESDDGDAVLDVADEGIHDGVEGAVIVEMTRARAAGFDDDGERERLGVGVIFHGDCLRDAVVGEREVFGVEAEDDVAVAAGDEDGDHDEVGTDGEFDLGVGQLGGGLLGGRLLRDGCGGERQQERQSEKGAHSNGSWTQTRWGRVRLQVFRFGGECFGAGDVESKPRDLRGDRGYRVAVGKMVDRWGNTA
jgi:hypothetical protein